MSKVMRVSFDGLEFIKREEGCKLKMYLDQVGKPTIGIGHLLTEKELREEKMLINGIMIWWKLGLTERLALDLLDQDLDRFERVVNEGVKVQIDQNQFDALVSFAFNIGDAGFLGSTLLKELNKYKYDQVPVEMKKWNKGTVDGKKKVLPVLKARREREANLFSKKEYK